MIESRVCYIMQGWIQGEGNWEHVHSLPVWHFSVLKVPDNQFCTSVTPLSVIADYQKNNKINFH